MLSSHESVIMGLGRLDDAVISINQSIRDLKEAAAIGASDELTLQQLASLLDSTRARIKRECGKANGK